VESQAPHFFDPAQICARILRSDPDAERELVERFLPRVRTMLALRTCDRDAADELGQEVMLAAICALREGKAREPERLTAFLFGIARNLANDYIRRRARDRSEPFSEAHDVAAPPYESSDRYDQARREIEQLDQMDRQVLSMTLADGLEPTEIAKRLGLSPETVRQRKSRALKRLLSRLNSLSRRGQESPL
jgi:RNA polymerase sigma factor (sigma-70 family)